MRTAVTSLQQNKTALAKGALHLTDTDMASP